MVDLSDEELEPTRSLNKDPKNHTGKIDLQKHEAKQEELDSPPPPVDVPESLDWREFGASFEILISISQLLSPFKTSCFID